MLMNLNYLIQKYSLQIRGILHIGAHYGQEYTTYINNNINEIIFFEPVPETFNTLLKNIKGSKAFNIALGNISGEVEMNIETSNQGMSSSILTPDLHLSQYPHIVFENKIKVKIDKLDNIEFDRFKFNMINIDVQGYELEVFRGTIKTLPHIDYIMTEINRDSLYKNCVLEKELDEFLSDYIRVETNWAGGTWGDALYIKKQLI